MASKKGKGTIQGQEAAQPSSSGLMLKLHEAREFFEQSKAEMKKVVWPSRKETVATSVAVVVFTVVASLFLGLVDFGLTKLLSVIL